ncbi:hypothetical protein AQJ58_02555 [Streptomyces sp. DSM 15324]|nr:hypothetical protein AQJ58_02555 [Streptomyces sp. DSM 15324]
MRLVGWSFPYLTDTHTKTETDNVLFVPFPFIAACREQHLCPAAQFLRRGLPRAAVGAGRPAGAAGGVPGAWAGGRA